MKGEGAEGEGGEGCEDPTDAWLTLAAVASKLEALCVTKVFPRCGVYRADLMEVRHRVLAAERKCRVYRVLLEMKESTRD